RFPNNTSWRFLDMYYEFPDPHNPFGYYLPETVWFDSLTELVTSANFVAIKVGDVNGSSFNNLNEGTVEIRNSAEYRMVTERELIPEGGSIFTMRGELGQEPVDGIQFEIECGN